MKYVYLVSILVSFVSYGQMSKTEIVDHRAQHLADLTDTSAHVLNLEEIEAFEGLDYFDFDATYQVKAILTKDIGKKFKMPTSTDRLPVYRRYGYADFEINGKKCRLEVYQNMKLKKQKKYKKFIFIPFRDLTSAKSTYGGGRYIETYLPEGDTLLLDFNLAFNPYCSYSYRYSCPIPPEANTLNVEINAGEKTPLGH